MRCTSVLITLLVVWTPAMADDMPHFLAGEDLAVETHKWDGKSIAANMQCFYADVNDYRCGAGSYGGVTVRVDFTGIDPAPMQAQIENTCDTIAKTSSPLCRFHIVFVYGAFEKKLNPDKTEIMYIAPESGRGFFSKPGR